MRETASTTYDLFEILPRMWNEFLIASRQILAVGFCQFERNRGDLVTFFVIDHHETMTKKGCQSAIFDASRKACLRCEWLESSVALKLCEDLNAKKTPICPGRTPLPAEGEGRASQGNAGCCLGIDAPCSVRRLLPDS